MGSPKPNLNEDEVVERIRGTLLGGIEVVAPGDDAALITIPVGNSIQVSVDTVVEGVHVDLALCSANDVGYKALMSALSDLAAMGARPLAALVALCVPGHGEADLALEVTSGLADASAQTACPVVGGDVSSAPELMVSVTVIGTTDGDAGVTRAGALVGDVIMVSGPLGGSAGGLRVLRARRRLRGATDEAPREALAEALAATYRRPVARIAEGIAARRGGVHAMIDVSDGLALDLHRLCDASGVGFALDSVPIAPGATLDEALGGGEDYVLVMTVAPSEEAAVMAHFAHEHLGAPVRIGTIVADRAERSLAGRPLARAGWQHSIR